MARSYELPKDLDIVLTECYLQIENTFERQLLRWRELDDTLLLRKAYFIHNNWVSRYDNFWIAYPAMLTVMMERGLEA